MLTTILRSALPCGLANRIRSSPAMQWLKINRMKVGEGRGLRFDPGPSNSTYASGNNELPVQEALAGCLKAGGVLYDIGSNVGFFTVIGAKLVGPSGIVYAFEPVPDNVACIRRNVGMNRFANVELIEKAVSSESGRGELALAAYAGGAALTSVSAPPDATTVISVDLVSVDDFAFGPGSRPPSVVKIDVEGAEIDVLKGMDRTLNQFRPIIIFEIDDGIAEKFDEKWRLCETFLTGRSYRVNRLSDSYPNTNWIVGHAIATPC